MMLKFYRLLWVPQTHDVEVLQTVVGSLLLWVLS